MYVSMKFKASVKGGTPMQHLRNDQQLAAAGRLVVAADTKAGRC